MLWQKIDTESENIKSEIMGFLIVSKFWMSILIEVVGRLISLLCLIIRQGEGEMKKSRGNGGSLEKNTTHTSHNTLHDKFHFSAVVFIIGGRGKMISVHN